MANDDKQPFPWYLGVFDAHCHPTDTLSSLPDIPNMKARVLTVMATRAQDQDLVADAAKDLSITHSDSDLFHEERRKASIVPSFGWHPWFSHQLYSPHSSTSSSLSHSEKVSHYQSVLTPPPSTSFIATLPSPHPISSFLSSTRAKLQSNPLALVGEIGIDRGFRLPEPWTEPEQEARDEGLTPGGREGRKLSPHRVAVRHQQFVLTEQLRLAGEMGRAVSVHGVQAHGILHDTLAATWKGWERKGGKAAKREAAARKREGTVEEEDREDGEGERGLRPFPPRICLHSYSGPAETVKQYLRPEVPVEIYFSFSSVINFDPPTGRVEDAVRAVPDDRVLVESDLHTAGERMDDMLEEIVRKICELKGWELEDGVRRLRDNWKRFVLGE
ncbi:Metallo-dependent hydrolase [Myriangium duriaei CBS 260.36]|uniref:Metallo-dependent hydrolase n=1 Tax=Myriangium duriaei CBS 260.36 TaxID=1168546 RepID=A0A9P4J8N5_9PEZI|nr:Metallo-dependent hydrolase [Myriangium duriaei CBS 260.36]